MKLLKLFLSTATASIVSLREVKKLLEHEYDKSHFTLSPIFCIDAANQLLNTFDKRTNTVAWPKDNRFQMKYDDENGAILLLEDGERRPLEHAHNFIRSELSYLFGAPQWNLQIPIKYSLPPTHYLKWLWKRMSIGHLDEIKFISEETGLKRFLVEFLDAPIKFRPFSDLLGKGSHGSVYAAENDHGEKVAVKVLRLKADVLEWYMDEISALKLVKDDPHFVKLHRAQVRDFNLELVFERLDGISGYDLMKKKVNIQDLPILAAVARKLLKGLNALHQKGFRHDDFKYDNVFFTRDGEVKIIDLGIASKMDQDFKVHGISGLSAPECFNDAFPASSSSDIWMLGSLLFMAHTGSDLSYYIDPARYGSAGGKIFDAVKDSLKSLPESEFKDFLTSILQYESKERATIEELVRTPFIAHAASDDDLQAWIKALFTRE